MDWQVVLMVVIVLPVMLLPAAFIWYLNIAGIRASVREARERRDGRRAEKKATLRT